MDLNAVTNSSGGNGTGKTSDAVKCGNRWCRNFLNSFRQSYNDSGLSGPALVYLVAS